MSIIELLNQVGLENVKVQFLSECMTRADWRNKKKATEIAFMTSEVTVGNLLRGTLGEKIGVIIWIPKDKLTPPLTDATPAASSPL
jgi:hypothetical protein